MKHSNTTIADLERHVKELQLSVDGIQGPSDEPPRLAIPLAQRRQLFDLEADLYITRHEILIKRRKQKQREEAPDAPG